MVQLCHGRRLQYGEVVDRKCSGEKQPLPPIVLTASVNPVARREDAFVPTRTRLVLSAPGQRHQHRPQVVEDLVTKPVKANIEARTDQVSTVVFTSRVKPRPRLVCFKPKT